MLFYSSGYNFKQQIISIPIFITVNLSQTILLYKNNYNL